jgi:hypothetical protein
MKIRFSLFLFEVESGHKLSLQLTSYERRCNQINQSCQMKNNLSFSSISLMFIFQSRDLVFNSVHDVENLCIGSRHEREQSFFVPVPVRKKNSSRSRREKVLGLGSGPVPVPVKKRNLVAGPGQLCPSLIGRATF